MRSAVAVPVLARTWPPNASAILRTTSTAVSLRDHQPESDLQAAKAGHHVAIAPGSRRSNGRGSKGNKAKAHDGNDAHRERAAADHRRPIEQQPHARQQAEIAIAVERNGQQRANNHRRGETEGELAAWSREKRHMRLSGLLSNREYGKNHSQRRFRQPDEEPARRTRLMRGDSRGGKRGETDGRSAPARKSREGTGAPHRFAKKAKNIRGAIFQGNENGPRGPSRFCRRHEF